MKKTVYITAPINPISEDHIPGQIFQIIIGDIIAGFRKIMGYESKFVAGISEFGPKAEEIAKNQNIAPEEICSDASVYFVDAVKRIGTGNLNIIKTSDPETAADIRSVGRELYDRRHIYLSEFDGWYCIDDELFLLNKDLTENKCPVCGGSVSKLVERNYFFRISNYQKRVIQHIKENPRFIQPDSCRNAVLDFLDKPLNDLCISRPKTAVKWGNELPYDGNFVSHPRFDALLSFMQAAGYADDKREFSRWWPSTHLVDDNQLISHAVYLTCISFALRIEPPNLIYSIQDPGSAKIKNLLKLADKYGPDVLKYFIFRRLFPGNPGGADEKGLISCYNSDLAGNLEGLVAKVMIMLKSYSNSRIPERPKLLEQKNLDLRSNAGNLAEVLPGKLEKFQLGEFIEYAMQLVSDTNRLLEKQRPMDTSAISVDRFRAALYDSAEILRLVAVFLSPVMPGKCAEILYQLGLDPDNPATYSPLWGMFQAGAPIMPGKTIFRRLE